MLLCTLIGCYGLLGFLIVIITRSFNTSEKTTSSSFCMAWNWGFSLLYPFAILPFVLRYYRVRFVFSNVTRAVRQLQVNTYPYNNPVRKSHMGENHILRILAVFVLFMAFVRVCLDELLENSKLTSDDCLSGSVLSAVMVFWVVEHCLELIVFLWISWSSRRIMKRKEFSMSMEMVFLAVCWALITAGAATLMALRIWQPITDRSDDWYWRWNTICDICYLTVAATIGTTCPFIMTYVSSGVNWLPLFGDCKVLRSLESILNNISALQQFRNFLMDECTLENLLLWVEIEIFKDSKNLRHAQRIFNKFLREESELEVTIVSEELRTKVFNRLRCRKNIRDYSCMFDEVQMEIFEYMKRESYPRFLTSKQSRMLIEVLDQEEFLCQSLIESGML
jgi:hypothetical protein